MDTDTLLSVIENIQINFDYTKRISDPVNRLNCVLILPRGATYSTRGNRTSPLTKSAKTSVSPRSSLLERCARRRPQLAKSEEKRVFSQATSPVPKQLSKQT